jgi:cytochrome c553
MYKSILHKSIGAALAAAALTMSAPVLAGMPAKAAPCNGCHMPTSPTNPHLCGQPKAYLVSATKAYKTGARNHPTMKALVSGLSDKDIDEVAAFFSAQPCK